MGGNALKTSIRKIAVFSVLGNFRLEQPGRPPGPPITMIDLPRASSVRARHFGPKKVKFA